MGSDCCVAQRDPSDIEIQNITPRPEFKILLLGASKSGKTTLFKQLKYIHGDGFNEEDLVKYKKIIHNQIVSQMIMAINITKKEVCLTAAYHLNTIDQLTEANNRFLTIAFINDCNKRNNIPDTITELMNKYVSGFMLYADYMESRQYILNNANKYDNNEMKHHIHLLWTKSQIKTLFHLRNAYELSLCDSDEYFWDNIDRIFEDEYIPNNEDIMKISVRSTGITEQVFSVSDLNFRIIDVGGLRSERKKWIHTFENVKAVMFLADASCYDEYLWEDKDKVSMNEQLELYKAVVNNVWFSDVHKFLCLTKRDQFEKKFCNIPLDIIKDNFNGNLPVSVKDIENEHARIDVIGQCFDMMIDNSVDPSTLYTYSVNLLDRDFVEKVFNDVIENVMRSSLQMAS